MNTPRPPATTDDTRVRVRPAARKRKAATTTAAARKATPKKKKKATSSKQVTATPKKKAVKKKATASAKKKKPAARKAPTAKRSPVTTRKATSKKKPTVSKKKAGVKKKAGAKAKAAPKKKVAPKQRKPVATKKKTTPAKPARTTTVRQSASAGPQKRMAKKRTVKKKSEPKKASASRPSRAAAARKQPTAAKKAARRRAAPEPMAAPVERDDVRPVEPREPEAARVADGRTEAAETGPAEPLPPAVEAAPAIPPLPEEDEEIVPYEEAEVAAAPARQAPQGTAPAEILAGIRSGAYHVSALGVLDDTQIARLAREQGLKVRDRERRSETLYRLLQEAPARRRPQTVFVEGLLELHPDGYGFLRKPERNYGQHPEDVYVAAGLIRKLGLKPGHWVSGTARQSRPGEPLLALQFVEEVNHEDANELQKVTAFENLTVVFPDTRFLLEVEPEDLEMRVIDLFCPLGRGQRALIVSPPRAGKTVILQKLADAIAHNSPDVDIVVLLVDERPEEVTNMRRSVRGEVIASTFDRPAANHIRIAELVMEKVKRMVEYGRHVVLLLDSITRLGRAYNNTSGPSGRILTGGLEAKALTKPKRFFGAARNIEDGGSLTIVATALVETGSRMDDVIFEEFKGSGNMEIVLDRSMANARIWPAIDLPASGTRNEDLLLHPEELRRVNLMRKAMSGQDPQGVMDGLREQMVQYRTNAELLMSIG